MNAPRKITAVAGVALALGACAPDSGRYAGCTIGSYYADGDCGR